MKILKDNSDMIREAVLETNSSFIDLKSIAARVHLKLPTGISSQCTRQDIAEFIASNCFDWGISIQNGHRLMLSDKKADMTSIGTLTVEYKNGAVTPVSGKTRIEAVIDECGFANVYDLHSGGSIIVTKDNHGRLVKAEGNYWPEVNESDSDKIHDYD
jgi:hypothetical protein